MPSRVTVVQCVRRHIGCNDASCSNKRVITDYNPRKNRHIGSESNAALDYCLFKILNTIRFRSGYQFIGKRSIWPDENIVLNSDTVPQLDSVFNGHIITNNDVILDKHMGANVAVTANSRFRQDNTKLPDRGVLTNKITQYVRFRMYHLIYCSVVYTL